MRSERPQIVPESKELRKRRQISVIFLVLAAGGGLVSRKSFGEWNEKVDRHPIGVDFREQTETLRDLHLAAEDPNLSYQQRLQLEDGIKEEQRVYDAMEDQLVGDIDPLRGYPPGLRWRTYSLVALSGLLGVVGAAGLLAQGMKEENKP